MEIVIKTVQFLLCLSMLIIVHESGHFVAARAFRVRVKQISIFFFGWFKFRRRNTDYTLGWLPLGGYVKLDDEDFSARAAWKRLIVMLSGIGMNVLFACAILCIMTHSVGDGIRATGNLIGTYCNGITHLFSPEAVVRDELGGMLSIGAIFPATWDWHHFWFLTAVLSIALAIMNLLPIPGLDGGQSLFTLYEVVTRRKPNPNFVAAMNYIGFFILIALIVYANLNDVFRLFR